MTGAGFASHELSKSQFFHNYKGEKSAKKQSFLYRTEGVVAFTKHVPIPKIMCHASVTGSSTRGGDCTHSCRNAFS